ncbi:MAG: hypothetical protein JNM09_29865 [Blastocatellia bacterium]|nr:hypothetical protein [Blastocatellia bacterium]
MNSEVAEQSQHINPPYGNEATTTTTFTEELRATTEDESPIDSGTTPKWWQSLIPRLFSRAGFNPFTAALTGLFLITSLSLSTWLIAQHFKHKAELARLAAQQAQEPRLVDTDGPVTPETLEARIEEAQKQLTDVQTQLTEQNADRVLSNQELLGIQNDTLQKEMDEIAKPQLDAPIIDLDPAKIAPSADATKETLIPVTVPPTAALFTVILHKPVDKSYPNYLVEVLDPKKPKPLWSGTKTPTPDPMNITMTLVRRNYPSGKYRIRLSGVDGKKKDVLETFNLEVKYLPPPKAAKKKR